MGFLELKLSTQELARQRAFYTETLGLELLEETPEHFTVQASSTRLCFSLSDNMKPYHFAFNVPENKLAEAKTWLLKRVELLALEGQTQFASEGWNAEQVYFLDADGNVLEFIARHELSNASSEPFSSGHILNVSEIGYVVPDVSKTVAALGRLGLQPYRKPNEKFAPVGDAYGLLIVSKIARPWFPTEIGAGVALLELTVSSAKPLDYTEPGLPYRLRGVTAKHH